MAKPSIFSKDYEKQMKKRKRRIAFLIIIVIILVTFLIAYIVKGNKRFKLFKINKDNKNVVGQKKENNIKKTSKDVPKKPVKENKKIINKKQKDKKEEFYEINIENVGKVKIKYEQNKEQKIFTSVDSENNSNIKFDINPSKNKVMLNSIKEQKIYCVDIEGNLKDISKENYTSSQGTVFTRQNQLSVKPTYIWCIDPKFINDNTIVFISQLPWFNDRNKQYIWMGSIEDLNYNYIQEIEAEKISFGKYTEKGLEINIDGNIKHMDNNGQLIQ